MPPPRPRLRVLLVETAVVVLAALVAAFPFMDASAGTRLRGLEAEFLTSSAHTAALALRSEGRLPLWQPYLGDGRPLLESPFAFTLNPISVGGALWLGSGAGGVKLSVVWYALLAAGGGWFLGWAAGLGSAGRLLLALLLLGKGNMTAMLGIGHFQLGVSQVYMPYAFGAALLVLRVSRARWPVILLALAVALQFLAGNIWHVLPTVLSLLVLAAAFLFRNPYTPGCVFDWRAFLRLAVAAGLAVGLAAAVLFPVFTNRAYIGGHDVAANGDNRAPVWPQLAQYITGYDFASGLPLAEGGERESRYNYTLPWWLLPLVLAPVGGAAPPGRRRLWIVALVLFAVFTLWGLGGLQPFRWLYNHLPGLGRWRFVGRAYGTASVWLALWAAVRVDAVWAVARSRSRWAGAGLLAIALAGGGALTWHNWREWTGLRPVEESSTLCLAWLYAQAPPPLTVQQGGYRLITPFLSAGVRQTPIEAAYQPLPVAATFYPYDLRSATVPRYAMPIRYNDLAGLEASGYSPMPNAPPYLGRGADGETPETWPCAWQRETALPYAYRVAADVLSRRTAAPPLLPADVSPVTVALRGYDVVALVAGATGGERAVVVTGEVAYPGWRAYVDGEPAPLESVGGYIGVQLPLSTRSHTVLFVYRPQQVVAGLWMTLLTAAGCTLALLLPARPAGP